MRKGKPMIFYINGICSNRISGLSIARIEFPESSGILDVDWDEQDFSITDGIFTSRLKAFISTRSMQMEKVL